MTERTRLISYLLYGLFSTILKKNTIKTPEVIFHIRLRFLAHTKEVSVGQVFFQLLKTQLCFVHLFCCFRPRARNFYSQLKRVVDQREIFIMPGHFKKIMPAQQPIRARVLLQPYNKNGSNRCRYSELIACMSVVKRYIWNTRQMYLTREDNERIQQPQKYVRSNY